MLHTTCRVCACIQIRTCMYCVTLIVTEVHEQQAKAKERKSKAKTNVESKSINLALVDDVVQKIQAIKIEDETQYTVASN